MFMESRPDSFESSLFSPRLPCLRPLFDHFSIVSEFGGDYIIDARGNPMSQKYPVIDRYDFEDPQHVAVFALGGSYKSWRVLSFNNIDKANPWFFDIGGTFNHIHVEPKLNYKVIGAVGNVGYILDDQFRQNHYQGYNAFRWDQPSDTYYGFIIGQEPEKIEFFH